MRKFIECKSRSTAKRLAPWAAKITKVEGGFHAFEFVTDFQIWKRQR